MQPFRNWMVLLDRSAILRGLGYHSNMRSSEPQLSKIDAQCTDCTLWLDVDLKRRFILRYLHTKEKCVFVNRLQSSHLSRNLLRPFYCSICSFQRPCLLLEILVLRLHHMYWASKPWDSSQVYGWFAKLKCMYYKKSIGMTYLARLTTISMCAKVRKTFTINQLRIL